METCPPYHLQKQKTDGFTAFLFFVTPEWFYQGPSDIEIPKKKKNVDSRLKISGMTGKSRHP